MAMNFFIIAQRHEFSKLGSTMKSKQYAKVTPRQVIEYTVLKKG